MVKMGWDASTIQYMFSTLLGRKIKNPKTFIAQCEAIKSIYEADSSGLIDSITDKMVDDANTNTYIESYKNNSGFETLLNEWLERINEKHRGLGIKTGIEGVLEQYYTERWKYSSFPIFYYGDWQEIGSSNNKLKVPMTIFVLDGCAIRSEDKDSSSETLGLFPYDYYLGDNQDVKITSDKHLITRPYGRPFDEYPVPFLIRRGIYRNWSLIDGIKNKQEELIDRVIPYFLLLKKGLGQAQKGVSEDSLKKSVTTLQEAIEKLNTTSKAPVHASDNSELDHLIPNLENMFKQSLFTNAEKGILAGFGFIDVFDSAVASRKESVINPKGFTSELRSGQKDAKAIIKDFVNIIKNNNIDKEKYKSEKVLVQIPEPRDFLTKDIKDFLAQAHGRGNISNRTYNELVVGNDYMIEVKRSKHEAAEGHEQDLYARVIQNQENNKGFDIPQLNSESDEKIPDDKKNGVETDEKYNMASKMVLEKAPYTKKDYPKYLNKYPAEAREAWIKAFNNALKYYDNESRAFKVAWKALDRKMKELNRSGKIDKKTYKKLISASKMTQELFDDITE